MVRNAWIAGLLGLAAVGMASPALAGKPGSQAPRLLLEGHFVAAPLSFTKFCMDYPSDCPADAGAPRVHLTAGQRAELEAVNHEVNDAIEPTSDSSQFRFWRLGVSAGDCNAFAVQKRHDLMKRGWPAAALALAVVKTASGEGHLILTVRTDAGDLVLDNLRDRVVGWDRTGYRWVMRQSEQNPQYWALLNIGRPALVAAIIGSEKAPGAAADAGVDVASPMPGRRPKGALPAKPSNRANESVSELEAPVILPTTPAILWSGVGAEPIAPAATLTFAS